MSDSAKAIQEALQKNTSLGTDRLRNLVDSFFACAGGEHVFAQMLWDEYNNPKTTPMIKSRITQFIMDSARHVERNTSVDSLDVMSNEELDRLIENVVSKVAERQKDGKEENKAGLDNPFGS